MPNSNYLAAPLREAPCESCGILFSTKISSRRFCSRKCAVKNREKINKYCKLCGIAYIGSARRGIYCSSSCASKAANWVRFGKLRKEQIGINCPECLTPLQHRTNRHAMFCSHKCAAIANSKLAHKRYRSKAICHPDKPLVSNGLCQRCWAKKYYQDNKNEAATNARKHRLLRFGITPMQWDSMYYTQKGLCPICTKAIFKPNNKEGRRAAAVDHDHSTGRVRGLVCDQCNRFKIAKNTYDTALRLVPYLSSAFDGRLI